MEAFVRPEVVGVLYALASAASIAIFATLAPLLSRFGNTVVTLVFAGASVVALLLLGFQIIPVAAFLIFQALNPILYLTIDVFAEKAIGDNEGETGRRRGLMLSLMSLAAVFAPLFVGWLVGEESEHLSRTFFAAAAVGALFMLAVAWRYWSFKDAPYETVRLREAFVRFWRERDLRIVVGAHSLLQFFFAWMVIYVPLYLATEVGLPWSQIGPIIAAGLIAFVIFEYPIGILADRFWGEKEMMGLGFIILALTSTSISFLASASFIVWMGVMFASRIGASMVEVTTESYFFKHIKSGNAQLISVFRLTRPLASLVGALAGSVSLFFLPFSSIFIVLGAIMLPGIALAALINDDTK
jgi:MFS family permease